MSRVFFDTNLFIYLMEEDGPLAAQVERILERMADRGDQLLTSVMTLGEVLVKPLAEGDEAWISQYESLLTGPGVSLLPFDAAAARIYGQVRMERVIRPPDAIQLACAAVAKTDLFITNNDVLTRLNVPGIQFITSLDRVWM